MGLSYELRVLLWFYKLLPKNFLFELVDSFVETPFLEHGGFPQYLVLPLWYSTTSHVEDPMVPKGRPTRTCLLSEQE